VFKLISRLFYFYLFNKVSKKNNNYYRGAKDINKKEGDVSIDKMPKKNKSKSDKLGDYVDYEEID
tara:strand:- start:3511 stop:3705 length:195 start_codon:yes stop_codon:yes gene_type:complete